MAFHSHPSRSVPSAPLLLLLACAPPLLAAPPRPAGEASPPPAEPVPPAAPSPAPPAGDTPDPIADALSRQGEPVLVFHRHLEALSNPYFQGRAPGTPGIERAADYIEDALRRIGLRPAFPPAVEGGSPSYRQGLHWLADPELRGRELSITRGGTTDILLPDTHFTVHGASGSGAFSGPVVFAGFSIDHPGTDYTTYHEGASLAGKAALILRYEPLTPDGRSRLTEDGAWSRASAVRRKIAAAVERGAEAVLLVTPPTPAATDPPLPTFEQTAAWSGVDVPVFQLAPAQADALLRAGDPSGEGRGLADFVRLAGTSGGLVPLRNVSVSLRAEIARTPTNTENVAALLPGAGPLAGEVVVIGAHYDHIGLGRYGSRTPWARGQVHPGADDNASGVAGVLLAAELLKRRYDRMGDQPRRSIVFALFTAEEAGLRGSRRYLESPPAPIEAHQLMVNLDMIGRLRGQTVEIDGFESSPDLRALIDEHTAAAGLAWRPATIGRRRSDHASFHDAGVPNVFFFTGMHDDYHAVTDTPEKIRRVGAVSVVGAAIDLALDAATRERRLPFAAPEPAPSAAGSPARAEPAGPGEAEDFTPVESRVLVGIRPGRGAEEGILVEHVAPNTPAAEAGLVPGDRIVAWNGKPLTTVTAWLPILASHEPGDVVKITVVRPGGAVELELRLRGSGG